MAESPAQPEAAEQWTLDGLRASGMKPKTPPGAFYYTGGMAPSVHQAVPSQSEFDLAFWNRVDKLGGAPFVALVKGLMNLPNVILCGGAVCSGAMRGLEIIDRFEGRPDFDWFVYGVSDPREMWKVAKSFVEEARKHSMEGDQYDSETSSVRLCGSVLSVKIDNYPEMQLVLRAFASKNHITEGFDVGICGMSYDGTVTTLTDRAAWSLVNRMLKIEPWRASPTYEKRLRKYMLRFGLGLSAPDMDPPEGPCVIELPRMVLHVTYADENGAQVDICPVRPYGSARVPDSDYDFLMEFDNEPGHPGLLNTVLYRNVATVVGRGTYVIVSSLYDDMPWLDRAEVEGHLTVSDFLSLDAYSSVIESLCRRRFIDESNIEYKMLVKYLGFSDGDAGEIMRSISYHGVLDIGDSLKRRKDAMIERFRSIAGSKVENWRIEDPGAQGNGSLNPEPMDARAYYGSEYREAPKLRSAPDESDLPVCAICLGPITVGANTAVLPCEHVFHLGKTAACGGFLSWTKEGNDTCPYCRANVNEATKSPVDADMQADNLAAVVASINSIFERLHVL